jgi:ketosteroid isomerase-like protein
MDAAAVARRWVDLYNDVPSGTYGSDRFVQLYDPRCRWREMSSVFFPAGRTSEQFPADSKSLLDAAATVLMDRHVELHEIIAQGDRAAMRYTWSATAKTELWPKGPAAGERLRMEVGAFIRVAEGKIVELTEILSAPLP